MVVKVLKKNFIAQYAFNILSIVSIVVAMVSLVSVNNLEKTISKNKFLSQQENGTNMIGKIPDVEIVNADGNVAKLNLVNDYEIEDSDFNSSKKEESGIVSNDGNDENNNIRDVSDDRKNVTDSLSSLNKIIPVSRNRNARNEIYLEGKNNNNVVKNGTKKNYVKYSKSDDTKGSVYNKAAQKVVLPTRISENFVVQVGAFKNKKQAEEQCRRIASAIEDKHCRVAELVNNFYRSVVYPFGSKQEANEFSVELFEKTKTKSFVRMDVVK